MFRRSRNKTGGAAGRGARLRIEQSLGAFPVGGSDVSPLYVLFTVSNVGEDTAVAQEVRLRAGREAALDLTGELGGDGGGPPREIPPGETATLWLRAKNLSGKLQDAGHIGAPKLKLLVTDSAGGEHSTTFKLRVDEYLQLKDE